jgi:hypothetical protein
MTVLLSFAALADTKVAARTYTEMVKDRCENQASKSTIIDFSINKHWTEKVNVCLEKEFLKMIRLYKNRYQKVILAGQDGCDKYLSPVESYSYSLAVDIDRDWLKDKHDFTKRQLSVDLEQQIQHYAEKSLSMNQILKKISK